MDRKKIMASKTQKNYIPEQLLKRKEAAKRLAICTHVFKRELANLTADGLQAVRIGKRTYYRAASIDKIVRRRAEAKE